MHERGEKCIQSFGREGLKQKDHLKNQYMYGRMGSKWTLVRLAGGGGGGD
jgi:hypothetical protein